MSELTFAGPKIPPEIQVLRAERRNRIKGGLAVNVPEPESNVRAAPDSGSDSDSDSDFGPSLPPNESGVDLEEEALRRLNERSLENKEMDDGKPEADRANWMSFALGEKPAKKTEKEKEKFNIKLASEKSSSSRRNMEVSENDTHRGPSLLEEHLQAKQNNGQDINMDWGKVRGTGNGNERLNAFLSKARGMNDKFEPSSK